MFVFWWDYWLSQLYNNQSYGILLLEATQVHCCPRQEHSWSQRVLLHHWRLAIFICGQMQQNLLYHKIFWKEQKRNNYFINSQRSPNWDNIFQWGHSKICHNGQHLSNWENFDPLNELRFMWIEQIVSNCGCFLL